MAVFIHQGNINEKTKRLLKIRNLLVVSKLVLQPRDFGFSLNARHLEQMSSVIASINAL